MSEKRVFAVIDHLGEGPLWHEARGMLFWVDILRGCVHTLDVASGKEERFVREPAVTAIAPRRGGGFVVATKRGFALWNEALEEERWIGLPEDEPDSNRCNDGKCDPRGRFFAGTMDDAEKAVSGSLYRLDPDLSIHRIESGIAIPNGPAFDASGERMIHVDTLERTLVEMRIDDDGEVCERKVFLHLDPSLGHPDGVTFDAEDHLWIALHGGSSVLRVDPRGRIVQRLQVPAPNVTSVTFGGPDLATLFVTTARKGMSEEELERHPEAGALFALEPGVRGRAPHAFAG